MPVQRWKPEVQRLPGSKGASLPAAPLEEALPAALAPVTAPPTAVGWRTHRASKRAGMFSACCCGGRSRTTQSACVCKDEKHNTV